MYPYTAIYLGKPLKKIKERKTTTVGLPCLLFYFYLDSFRFKMAQDVTPMLKGALLQSYGGGKIFWLWFDNLTRRLGGNSIQENEERKVRGGPIF